jgi:hypothetical protein
VSGHDVSDRAASRLEAPPPYRSAIVNEIDVGRIMVGEPFFASVERRVRWWIMQPADSTFVG